MNPRVLSPRLFALLLAAVPAVGFPARPNFVVVLADDLGFSDLGCYGGEIETPVLDSLAGHGLRFSQFTNTAKCHSSRVSLLSGLWCGQAGNSSLRKAAPLPRLLNDGGYATWMVGKWHLAGEPLDFGFEKYFGHLSGASDYIEGNDSFRLGRDPYTGFGGDASEFYLTDAVTDHAIGFLEARSESADERPFLLYVAYNAPHTPLQAPEALVRKYRGRYLDGWQATRAARFARQREIGLYGDGLELPEWEPGHRKWADLDDLERSWEDYRMAIYAAMVESVDNNLGRLKSALEGAGEWDNTVFLFMSDNGANPFERSNRISIPPWKPRSGMRPGTEWAAVSNTPFRWYKQNNHRGGIATPLIVHWPDGLSAAGWNHTPGHLVDVLPTVLALAGIEYPAALDGRDTLEPAGVSLAPALSGEAVERAGPLFYYYADNAALREGDWKLVTRRSGPWELYDLAADPFETRDLSGGEPRRVAAMTAEWTRIAREVNGLGARYFAPRLDRPVPFGTASIGSGKGRKGEPKSDEQRPEWGPGQPPVPLPGEAGAINGGP